MKPLKAISSVWDDDGYIVSIGRADRPDWRDIPIGPELSKEHADIIANWLNVVMPCLQAVIIAKSNETDTQDNQGVRCNDKSCDCRC